MGVGLFCSQAEKAIVKAVNVVNKLIVFMTLTFKGSIKCRHPSAGCQCYMLHNAQLFRFDDFEIDCFSLAYDRNKVSAD